MGYDPTPEQQAAIDAFHAGQHLVIEAGAGTGKTSTLKFLADLAVPRIGGHPDGPRRRGIYMAYNASIAKEARADFRPLGVESKTGHGHALGLFRRSHPGLAAELDGRCFGSRYIDGTEVARILNITGPSRITDDVVYAPRQVARVALETVERFTRSADNALTIRHVPIQTRLEDPDAHSTLAAIVLPHARKAWTNMTTPGGTLNYSQDVYRKLVQLSGTLIPGDFLFLDEAQDSTGCVTAWVKNHQAAGVRIVAVGDENQAINGWMGATSAMEKFGGTRLPLSKSFRFGPAVAAEANKWLTLLGSSMRITGHDPVGSTVGPIDGLADAILTRTNAEAVDQVMRLQSAGVHVGLQSNVAQQVLALAKAAAQLKERGATDNPQLCAFTSWGQVQDFVEQDHGGSDLKVFVKLVDEHGTPAIIAAMSSITDSGRVFVSTVHRSKGREWNQVRIAGDFKEPEENPETGRLEPPSRDELMLAYVAVTRAKQRLDLGGLAWVDQLLGATPIKRTGANDPAAAWARDHRAEAAALAKQHATEHHPMRMAQGE